MARKGEPKRKETGGEMRGEEELTGEGKDR